MKLQEFIEKVQEFLVYLEVERNMTVNTLRSYASDLKQLTTFWQSLSEQDKKHLDIKRVIERYLVHLYYNGIEKSSIARKLSSLTSFERFLRTQGIKLNLKLERPRVDKKLPVYLTVDEMFYLLDKIDNKELPTKHPYRDKAILELLYATGIRCSELIGITLDVLSMDEKTIRIMGKGRTERIVLFNDAAYKKIIQYLTHERPTPRSKTEHLFLNHQGQKITPRSVQRIVQMFRSFLKIDRPISPHKIRHTFATHMLNQGADLRVVQELLGHRSLSSTEKYTHVSLERLTDLCNTIHPANNMIKKKKS